MRVSRTVVLLLAAGLLFALALASWRAMAPGPARADDLFVSQRVSNEVANTGRARVIVEVRLPGAFVAEGELPTRAHVAAQRASFASVQSQVLARLQGRGHTVLHQFQTVPYLVLEVQLDALRELEASGFYVRRVVEDALYTPMLPQSVPLVEGNQAWTEGFDGTGVVVAILDTGVDRTHPFLAGKVVEEACYGSTSFGRITSFCPNGQTEQIGPGAGVNCPLSVPVCWHGTHVAGIAAGNGAGAGVSYSGVAKGARIMAVQVFSQGVSTATCGGAAPCVITYSSDIMRGLERVYSLHDQYTFSSVNLSVGGGIYGANCDGDPLKAAIDNLRSVGIATVAAAGNNGWTGGMSAPACVSTAVSVGNTDKSDVVWPSSNVAPFLSLFAPGGLIQSSYPGGLWLTASGTSMAAPHVTGAFAVLRQAVPGASVSTLLTALQQTGAPVTDTRVGGTVTKPRIRIAHALEALHVATIRAAVLPLSRSVQVTGARATAFAAIVNAGTTTALNCAPAVPANPPAGLGTFTYQTATPTNALSGTPNTPANIAPGAIQNYVFGFLATDVIPETSLAIQFLCDNTASAPQTPGVNNFFIVASDSPVPDTIALVATLGGDGVVRIPGPAGTQLFAIGTSNVGATGTIVVSGDTGGVALPLALTVCETGADGNCLAAPTPSVTVNYLAGTNRSFAFFAQASGSIPFDPAANRVFARLKQTGVLRGATSAAVCTSPNAGC